MSTYTPGESFAHRLDPRSKLAVQAGFAVAALAHTTVPGLAVLTGVCAAILLAARTHPARALADLRLLLPFLVLLPVVEGATLGPPWFSVADARAPALASYRTLLVVLVSVAYVRTTPVRESRAAVQRLVPGKPGRVLGTGVALVFRNLAVFRGDLRRAREASAARLGDERPLVDRMRLVATAGLARALGRTETLSLAMRARCLSWNPTLPPLALARVDVPVLALACTLFTWGLL
ncbi:energy-coupling factor transporter transmembrane component T family protein [Halomarina ordinaria]|uniref:Energy-coupling factor transporter transmembrane component T family protein n=1 Tax=Halomarina ordinaria TaxID=3033939 RepID=A0ABD5UEK3_9EURY|nr:energy-coupling factor transporter transmembrane component T [Halomarina sp. PSRA2]